MNPSELVSKLLEPIDALDNSSCSHKAVIITALKWQTDGLAPKALDWIDLSVELDLEIVQELKRFSENKHNSQKNRHCAFALAIRWLRNNNVKQSVQSKLLTLSFIIFIVVYFSFNFIGAKIKSACIIIGIQWVLMTLAFEFIFGYFEVGKTWSDILHVFNIAKGDLFLLVLLTCLLSPSIVSSIKVVRSDS